VRKTGYRNGGDPRVGAHPPGKAEKGVASSTRGPCCQQRMKRGGLEPGEPMEREKGEITSVSCVQGDRRSADRSSGNVRRTQREKRGSAFLSAGDRWGARM